jgi:hypothetical protein
MTRAPRHRILVLVLGLAALAAAPATAARRARPINVRVPRFTVPAHSDREVCHFVRVKTNGPFDLGASSVVNQGNKLQFTSHHFIMWAYAGKEMDAFPANKVVDSKACLDFGPADQTVRHLLRTEQTVKRTEPIAAGLALRVQPAATDGRSQVIGLILNTHWINSSDRPQRAAVKVKLIPRQPGTVKRYLSQIFEATANGTIDVAPGGTSSAAQWAWGPGQPDFGSAIFAGAPSPDGAACVTSLTSHMHKRGKLFRAELVTGSGTRTPLFETDSYTEPPNVTFPQPLLVRPGDRIVYTCMHDNGVTTPQKLGCEETPGVAPGTQLIDAIFNGLGLRGAAKSCRSDADCPPADAAYPGRSFTGRCVPARLVFGFTGDDDMCILPGTYFPANLAAPPGLECDITALPAIN